MDFLGCKTVMCERVNLNQMWRYDGKITHPEICLIPLNVKTINKKTDAIFVGIDPCHGVNVQEINTKMRVSSFAVFTVLSSFTELVFAEPNLVIDPTPFTRWVSVSSDGLSRRADVNAQFINASA